MAMQTRIFDNTNPDEIEQDINDFCKDLYQINAKVIDIKYQVTNIYFSAMVIYDTDK